MQHVAEKIYHIPIESPMLITPSKQNNFHHNHYHQIGAQSSPVTYIPATQLVPITPPTSSQACSKQDPTCSIKTTNNSPATRPISATPKGSIYDRRKYEISPSISGDTLTLKHQHHNRDRHQLREQQLYYLPDVYGNIFEGLNDEERSGNSFIAEPSSTAKRFIAPLQYVPSLERLIDSAKPLRKDRKLTKDCDIRMIYDFLKHKREELNLRDHDWLKCHVKNVFLGNSLVNWLGKNVVGFKNRGEIVKYANKMLELGLIERPFHGDQSNFSTNRLYGLT